MKLKIPDAHDIFEWTCWSLIVLVCVRIVLTAVPWAFKPALDLFR